MSAFLPQLAAGATETVAFKTQAGPYSTTSTIRPSDIIAASDYKVVLTGVNSSWVPEYYGVWPNGVQVGCQVVGGSVPTGSSGCALRIVPPTIAGANNCLSDPNTEAVGAFTAKIDNAVAARGTS